MERLKGIGVSPGVSVGRAVILTQRAEVMRFPIPADRIAREIDALQHARAVSREQLHEISRRIGQGPGSELAALFDAQLMILEDPLLVERAEELIRTERVNAAWAVHRAYEDLCQVFLTMEDPYLRERETDVADVAGRLRMNLRPGATGPWELLQQLDGPSILIADELTASLAAQLDWGRVLGFATDAGSRTHHTAILARSLHIPAIVGLHDASQRITAGLPVVLDGGSGELVVDPSAAQIDAARRHAPTGARSIAAVSDTGPAVTVDGVAIRLEANLELLEDLPTLRAHGAEGVGLYRSEFMLHGRSPEAVDEETQFELYRGLIRDVAPLRVTVRTFDVDERQIGRPIGRDRRRSRPGLRGLRLGLARPEVLQPQLRALVRASAVGPMRIMFPFVTAVDEIREARRLVEQVAREVGVVPPPVGVMIEVPAAALAADLLAPEVDFFTIGTNDLIQYCLAVDRTDDRVSDRYEPLHPAVLRMIRHVRRAARHRAIPVSLCGEMASDPALIGLLIGLGLTEFSMTPVAISTARQVVRDLRADQARRLAGHALRLSTSTEIEQYLLDAVASPTSERGRLR